MHRPPGRPCAILNHTMTDKYGRSITYLRISVTDMCNMRCRYCMPVEDFCERQLDEMLTQEELAMAVRAGAELGIKKVRLTGGEPLVNKDIISICEATAATDGIEEVVLTTNGVLLPRYAHDLKKAGVSRLNISLDTLQSDKFKYITRIGSLADTLAGIDAALDEGFEKIKINAVLIGGFNTDEIADLAELTVRWPVDVRFIELMPMYDSGDFGREAFVSSDVVFRALPDLEETGMDGVARTYTLPGAMGKIGLISPVTSHFCADCSRMRLTADGKLKPCLHSDLEYSIKGLSYEEMLEQFKCAVMHKPKWHGELSWSNRSGAGRNMNAIGG